MNQQLNAWKSAAEGLWASPRFRHAEALNLATEIVRHGRDAMLLHAVRQVLPSLRAATAQGADRACKAVAARRFAAVYNALHALSVPQFGKRQKSPAAESVASPTDHMHRGLLGLPLHRRLFGPEIQQAYKRAAKTAHPDAGGNERAFTALVAARDALMKSL